MTPSFSPQPLTQASGSSATARVTEPADAPTQEWSSPSASEETPATTEDASIDPAAVPTPMPLQPRSRAVSPRAASVVRRLKAFLHSLDMTVYQISQATARPPFGKGTRSHIRDAFYAEIESGQTPDIHQIAALSRLTGYRFVDWLSLFGYHADDVLKLQLELQTERTILLPSTIYDPLVMLPWIRRLDTTIDLDRTQPLASLIDAIGYEPLGALDQFNRRRYLYARVGRRDDMVRSRVAAGSVIRVDPTHTAVAPVGQPRPVYLVQHLGGLSCCYVERLDDQHVVLLPDDSASRVMRCRLGTEAVILGTVDLELRPLQQPPAEASPLPREKSQTSHRLRPFDAVADTAAGPGAFARSSRERIGVCFREAQTMTRSLAARFVDKNYNVALGSLSDAETQNVLPRHIPKIFSLCIAYSMDFWQYLRAGGVQIDQLGGAPIPSQFLRDDHEPQDGSRVVPTNGPGSDGTQHAIESVLGRLGEIPFFLLRSLGNLVGQEQLSLDDVYVWGQRERVLHPLFAGGILVIVNRRQRRVPDARLRQSPAQRPLYLIRTPAGQLVAGLCALDGDLVLVHPHNASRTPVLTFPTEDIEVIGRVSAILRTIGNGNGEPARSAEPRATA
jgi:hypothetical protein